MEINALRIQGTDETPTIVLDKNENIFEISGISIPENTLGFYKPVIDWLNTYKNAPNKTADFTFKMEYFNTSSSKVIMDLLMIAEEIHKGGSLIKILWHHEGDDEDMQEAGEEYAEMLEVPFEIIAV